MESETDTFWPSSSVTSLGGSRGSSVGAVAARGSGSGGPAAAQTRRTLLELAETLFQYVCRLNRSAKKGVGQDPAHVRGDFKAILIESRAKAATDLAMAQQWKQVEPILIF